MTFSNFGWKCSGPPAERFRQDYHKCIPRVLRFFFCRNFLFCLDLRFQRLFGFEANNTWTLAIHFLLVCQNCIPPVHSKTLRKFFFEKKSWCHMYPRPFSKNLSNFGKYFSTVLSQLPWMSSGEIFDKIYFHGKNWIYVLLFGGKLSADLQDFLPGGARRARWVQIICQRKKFFFLFFAFWGNNFCTAAEKFRQVCQN